MPSNESDAPPGGKKPRTQEEVNSEIDELRSQLQNLTSTVRETASKQIKSTQQSLETAIRNNPLAAVGIAAGLGFLYAVIRR